MKNYTSRLSYLLLTALLLQLTSCLVTAPDPYQVPISRQKENFYYVPTTPNTGLLKDKNALSVNVYRSSSKIHSGAELQAEYMPTSHLALIANYSIGGNKQNGTLEYNRLELGGGYVLPVSRNWHFEMLSGLGLSKIENYHHTGGSNLKGQIVFLQPGMAVTSPNKQLQFGVVSKFGWNHLQLGRTFIDKDRESFTATQLDEIRNNPNQLIWEPGFIFRFGWKPFLFHTGYALSQNFSNDKIYQPRNNFSLGFSLLFYQKQKSIEVHL